MVRVIVFALIALGWWLAAPDRFTAAARTATGTGLRAAGTGARGHWNGGRDGRALGRTERRDRWHKRGGWWRRLLGLEHGAVITGKAVKGAGKLAGAAVRPVPGAVRDGWRKGQDRHRARTAGRPVPVALDPPWWRRPDLQDSSGQAGQDSGDRCPWTITPHALSLMGVQKACGRPATDGVFCAEHAARSRSTPCVTCGEMLGPDHTCSPSGPDTQTPPQDSSGTGPGQPEGEPVARIDHEAQPTRTPFFPDAPDGPSLDSEADIRARNPELARINPDQLTEGQRRFWHLRDRGYPGALDQDGWPAPDFHTGAIVNPMPYLRQAPATATATPTTPTTNGAPMPAPTELRTHVAVQDFAQQIDHLSENSDFVVVAEQARTVGAQSRAGGFGAEMDTATDELEATAKRFAASVDALREQAAAYGKTSLSVQGS